MSTAFKCTPPVGRKGPQGGTAGAPGKSGRGGILMSNLAGGAALLAAMLLSGLLLARPSLGQGVSPGQVQESTWNWSGMLVYRDANRSPWPQKINGDRVIFFRRLNNTGVGSR
jgi:hypothetical protein